MNELLNLKVEISDLDLKENTISNLLTSANKVQEEIERLNNVIDELEKSLVNEINNKYSSNEYKQTMNLVLLKLKKLKGSDE